METEIVNLAKLILKSNENYLENVLALTALGNRLHGQCWDTEFHLFALIASHTDHLPLNKVKPYCSAQFIEQSNSELLETINYYKSKIVVACNKLIAIYGNA